MKTRHPTPAERDERVILPLDPEEALRGLLAVKPDDRCPECGAAVTMTGGHVTAVGDHDSGACENGHALHRIKGGTWTKQ